MKKKAKSSNCVMYIFSYWHDPQWNKFVGATVKIWDFAHNVSNLGHQVVLFLPKYHFEKQGDHFKIIEIPIVKFPILSFLSFNLFLAFILITKVVQRKPDVIYVRRGISIIPFIYSKIVKSILVFEVNDDPYRKNKNIETNLISSLRYRLSKTVDEIYIKFSDIVCVITKEIKNKIVKANSTILESKMVIFPSGANTELFKPLNQSECREILNFDPSNYYIGYVGSLLYYSGVDILINAVPYILEKIKNCYFVIVGEGPMKKQWIQLVKEKKLDKYFYFLGQVDYEDIPRHINCFDICVAPYRSTVGLGSPVKIFDYMACGKPVIASKIDGITNFLKNTDTVRFVSADNSELLAKSIIDLLNKDNSANRIGLEGRKFVKAKYSRNKLIKKILIKVKEHL